MLHVCLGGLVVADTNRRSRLGRYSVTKLNQDKFTWDLLFDNREFWSALRQLCVCDKCSKRLGHTVLMTPYQLGSSSIFAIAICPADVHSMEVTWEHARIALEALETENGISTKS